MKSNSRNIFIGIICLILCGVTYFLTQKGSIGVEIQICNNTNTPLQESTILRENNSLPQINFGNILPTKCSEYQKTEDLHKNLGIQIYTLSDTFSKEKYQIIPSDLIGVEYLKSGKYSVNIENLKASKKAILESNSIEYKIVKSNDRENNKLNIQLCNNTEKNIENASILQGPSFGNIDTKKCSEFQEAKGLYQIIPLDIFVLSEKENIYGEKYISFPIDYVGESLLETGNYTLNINSLDDSPENTVLIHDNGVQYEIVHN